MASIGSQLAGLWYPADPQELKQVFQTTRTSNPLQPGSNTNLQNTNQIPEPGTFTPSVLVMPHAGLAYSARGQAAALAYLTPNIQSILILSPSHRVALPPETFIFSNADTWHTPLGRLPGVDFKSLSRAEKLREHPEIVANEHGIELMLPGIAWKTQQWNQKPEIGALVVPSVRTEDQILKLSQILNTQVVPALPQPALVLVSSDFCHYGPRFSFTPWGSFALPSTRQQVKQGDLEIAELAGKADQHSIQQIIKGLQKPTMPTICGIIPLLLATLLDQEHSRTGHVLDYYHSDDGGHDENAVAYCPMVFTGGFHA